MDGIKKGGLELGLLQDAYMHSGFNLFDASVQGAYVTQYYLLLHMFFLA
jgi:hypothetical protein